MCPLKDGFQLPVLLQPSFIRAWPVPTGSGTACPWLATFSWAPNLYPAPSPQQVFENPAGLKAPLSTSQDTYPEELGLGTSAQKNGNAGDQTLEGET